jgi:two-component system response regulator RegX3
MLGGRKERRRLFPSGLHRFNRNQPASPVRRNRSFLSNRIRALSRPTNISIEIKAQTCYTDCAPCHLNMARNFYSLQKWWPMNYDCLIVDDERELASGTCEYFNLFGVSAHYALNADDALDFLREHTVSLILLDINLGQGSGFALCKTLRETLDIPILFVSARTSSEDMLLALNIGGDDYIQKPFTLSVLLAKVKAVLKRYGAAKTESRLRVDAATERIMLDGAALHLTHMEYRLLKYLIDNKGRVVGKNELFEKVWDDCIVGDGTLNVHIRRLREKVETDPNEPLLIKTVWGVGYVYDEAMICGKH